MIIAHGGSSSPGLYISRTGVVGAPYSGQKHPGHPAFLKAAEETSRGPIIIGLNTEENKLSSRHIA